MVSVKTKALTSAVIVGLGDVACQALLEGRSLQGGSCATTTETAERKGTHRGGEGGEGGVCAKPFDYARLGNITLLGAVLVAPVLHVWYGFLGRKLPGTSIWPVVGRVVFDQALFAPTFIAIFFLALAVLLFSSHMNHLAFALLPAISGDDFWTL